MSRKIEIEIDVPGSVEEVWETIATGPGITSWFTPATVVAREGGEVVIDFGAYGKETQTVTAWDPPHRVVFQGDGDWPFAYEWLVEAKTGDTCVVRLVNSGFGEGGDWDDQYDGMSTGWQMFMTNLRLQLTHFRGRRAQTSTPSTMMPGPNEPAWKSLCGALGVSTDLAVGDRFDAVADTPGLAGVVEAVRSSPASSWYLVLLDGGAGIALVAAEGGGEQVGVFVYHYTYDDVERGTNWSTWLSGHWPAPVTD